MRLGQSLFSLLILGFHFTFAQSSLVIVERDVQAATLLQNAVRSMGGNVVTDSEATGSVVVVAG